MFGLVRPEEDISKGNCCEVISKIEKGLTIQVDRVSISVNSFSIQDSYNTWRFSSQDLDYLYKFRQIVKEIIILRYVEANKLDLPEFITDNTNEEENIKWSW